MSITVATQAQKKTQLRHRCGLLLVLVSFFTVCLLVEVLCPLYFDAQTTREAGKLAGLLGAEFELQKESPYYNEEKHNRLANNDGTTAFQDPPHTVQKRPESRPEKTPAAADPSKG